MQPSIRLRVADPVLPGRLTRLPDVELAGALPCDVQVPEPGMGRKLVTRAIQAWPGRIAASREGIPPRGFHQW